MPDAPVATPAAPRPASERPPAPCAGPTRPPSGLGRPQPHPSLPTTRWRRAPRTIHALALGGIFLHPYIPAHAAPARRQGDEAAAVDARILRASYATRKSRTANRWIPSNQALVWDGATSRPLTSEACRGRKPSNHQPGAGPRPGPTTAHHPPHLPRPNLRRGQSAMPTARIGPVAPESVSRRPATLDSMVEVRCATCPTYPPAAGQAPAHHAGAVGSRSKTPGSAGSPSSSGSLLRFSRALTYAACGLVALFAGPAPSAGAVYTCGWSDVVPPIIVVDRGRCNGGHCAGSLIGPILVLAPESCNGPGWEAPPPSAASPKPLGVVT